ncbi:hypothetical protein LCGC14_0377180 [marine sediment metagenome]|uniref:AP2/ERF domain-containing protein n=1 Tax=marine sediment metagenome TaxID=412755 RepID=A0A0F9TLS0_9ZZZZ
MKRIKLTQGFYAVVDNEDYASLNHFSWQAARCCRAKNLNTFVAVRSCYCPFLKKQYTIFMHRQIMSCPRGLQVDHINHDQLNNRKENLRVCTCMQNMQNSQSYNNSSSRYKGVSWFPPTRKWQADIRVNKKKIHLGCFLDEHEAAKTYDVAAKKHFKEFANTNF